MDCESEAVAFLSADEFPVVQAGKLCFNSAMGESRTEIVERLVNPGIIAVVRARSRSQVRPLAEALLAGGVTAIEITMTTPDAIESIREVSAELGDQALIGVGTILDANSAEKAINAGAQFVVTPILKPEIVPVAHSADKPVMLGSYSPTEAQEAHRSGCDFVKLFPADGLGPAYIKAIRAPLPHLKIVPTGGVNLETMESFLKAGCAALGVGSSMITKNILEKDDWAQLTANAKAFVEKRMQIG